MLGINNLNKNDIFVMGCVWFSAIVSLMANSLNQIALYVVLPLAFVVTFASYGSIKVNKYFNQLALLYLWILFSALWATYTDIAMSQLNQVLGSFILCYIFAVKSEYKYNIIWMYLAYILILLGDWYYAYNNMFDVIDIGVERLNDEKLNANTFAYHTFYATFSLYMLGAIVTNKFWKSICHWCFILTIPLSFYTAIYTASRQVLIIQIPLIAILLYIRYIKDKGIGKNIVFILAFLACVSLVIPTVKNVYNNSLLSERGDIAVKDDSRVLLVKEALQVAFDNFLIGVGPGNFQKYSSTGNFSHNVYLELFANEGIVGLLIYVSILFAFLREQWQRYKLYNDDVFLSFFVFGIFFVVDGVFYSFYQYLWLIGFFIWVVSHSDCYYINNEEEVMYEMEWD